MAFPFVRCLHHPHEGGLGLCVLARKPCTAWVIDTNTEIARGVELDGEDLDLRSIKMDGVALTQVTCCSP